MLCVNLSGSMLRDVNGKNTNDYTQTRLYSLQVAMIEMLTVYGAQPNSNTSIDLIDFNTELTKFDTTGMSVTDAIAAICAMSKPTMLPYNAETGGITLLNNTTSGLSNVGGNTWYNVALNDTDRDYDVQSLLNGALQKADASDTNTETRFYFVSDGEHNGGSFTNDGNSKHWVNYLKDKLAGVENFKMLAMSLDGLASGSLNNVAGSVGDVISVPSGNPALLGRNTVQRQQRQRRV